MWNDHEKRSGMISMRRLAMLLTLPLAIATLAFGQDEEDDRPWDDPDGKKDERFEKAAKHHLRGEFAEAFALYDEILAERGNDVPTIITYGNMLWKLGRLDEAEARFKLARKLMPDHIKAPQWLGQFYWWQGRRALAHEQFDALLKIKKDGKFIREDVLHSAWINKGKLSMVEENWFKARKFYRMLKAEGGKADRNTGIRGLKKMSMMNRLGDWARADSARLMVHFAPSVKQFRTPDKRQAWVDSFTPWIESTASKLKMKLPDPWHVYVFQDDGECSALVGRDEAHGWDYSWWLSFVSIDAKYPVKQTLAVQLATRSRGSRPKVRSLVEGLCAYLAGEPVDPHAHARALMKSGRLPSIKQMCEKQRGKPQYEVGMSYVRYMIDTFGFDRFMNFWARFNVVANAPQFKIGRTTRQDWQLVLDLLMGEELGTNLDAVESGWRAALGR